MEEQKQSWQVGGVGLVVLKLPEKIPTTLQHYQPYQQLDFLPPRDSHVSNMKSVTVEKRTVSATVLFSKHQQQQQKKKEV